MINEQTFKAEIENKMGIYIIKYKGYIIYSVGREIHNKVVLYMTNKTRYIFPINNNGNIELDLKSIETELMGIDNYFYACRVLDSHCSGNGSLRTGTIKVPYKFDALERYNWIWSALCLFPGLDFDGQPFEDRTMLTYWIEEL
jgi:hypothetical protein